MEEIKDDVVLEDNNVNTEEGQEQGSLNYDVDVSLEQDEEQSIISKLMEENPGMEEEDLADQIEEMKSKVLEDKKAQAVDDLKRIDAVKERDGNSELSDEEAWEIVLQEEEESKQESILKDPFSFDSTPDKKEDTKVDESQKLQEMEQKVAQAEAVLNDPLIDGYLKFKQSGNGSFRDYMKSFELDKDYDAMSDKEIYKMSVNGLGLTEEEIEYEMDRFDDLSPVQKKLETRKMREDLKKQQEDRIKNVAFQTSEQSVEQQKRMQETQKKNHEQFVGLTRSMVNKGYYGLNLTEDMTKAIHDHVISGKIGFVNADGTVNVKKMFDFAAWDLFKKDVLQNKVQQGKVKGQKAEFIKRAAPKRTGLKTTKVGGRTNDYNAYLKARGDAAGRRGVSGGNITL
jgi:hypothetical protein